MFDPKRAAVVDRTDTSVLIRGNMPLNAHDRSFAYDEIAAATGVDLSGYARFISVSLIDNTGERENWSHELAAFGVDGGAFPVEQWPPYLHLPDWNPRLKLGTSLTVGARQIPASLVWWPIEGMAPNDDPAVFLRSPGWNLVGLTAYLTALFMSPRSAVYFHCTLGADRTGALHTAFLIARHNLGADEALDRVTKATAAGAPSMDYQRLARAYAEATR